MERLDERRTRNTVAIAAVLLAGLGACAPIHDELSRYEHDPKVLQTHEATFAHDVAFTANAPVPSEAEQTALETFIARLGLRSGDTVELVGAASTRGWDDPRYRAVGRILARHGISAALRRNGEGTSPSGDSVRVLVRRHLVTLPPCPDWTKPVGSTFDNQVHSNWGCANAVNLGLMLADPSDLVAGRTPGPTDAEQAVTAIQRYRAGQTKPLANDSAGNPDAGAMAGDALAGGGEGG